MVTISTIATSDPHPSADARAPHASAGIPGGGAFCFAGIGAQTIPMIFIALQSSTRRRMQGNVPLFAATPLAA
jgi:hypothetical protein